MRYVIDEPDESERAELRAQAAAERAAARRWCAECHHTGGHAIGCPAAPDEPEEEPPEFCDCGAIHDEDELGARCKACGGYVAEDAT